MAKTRGQLEAEIRRELIEKARPLLETIIVFSSAGPVRLADDD